MAVARFFHPRVLAAIWALLVVLIPVWAQSDPPPASFGMVSDWSHHHLLYPESRDIFLMSALRDDPRYLQDWYIRHPEAWWAANPSKAKRGHRDWSVSLGTVSFLPLFDGSFVFSIGTQAGFGSLNLISQAAGSYLATAGSITVTGAQDIGTFPLYPGGPAITTSPNGAFLYDNLAFPTANPTLDVDGLLFNNGGGLETNVWGNSVGNYSFYTGTSSGNYPIQITSNGSFTFNIPTTPDPGGGQTYPAKFVFDVTKLPSCTNDYVVIGLPVAPGSAQANLVGLTNLYTSAASNGFCAGTGPTVKFAYASGSGQIPASVALSQSGTQIAFVENSGGVSYLHVLTIGTTGSNGTSATAPAVPGTGNNAFDTRVRLTPDGTTNQGSTSAVWVYYTPNDANDVAYVTTFSTAGVGSGYVYKLSNVFNGALTPTIVWSAPVTAIPSTPVYDRVSNKVFFTDSAGRIDYIVDSGASPSVTYGAIVASGTTSENPVIVDSTHQMVYASFNSNGSNAVVVQAPTSMASSVSVPVGTKTTTYTGPYAPDFNNAWYTGSGTPLMYVAGTGTGTLPTLYSVGFNGSGVMNNTPTSNTALTTASPADSSAVTEFFNSTLNKEFLFVGVTDHCIATVKGGTAGCVMSLDITAGFPTVNSNTVALAATGGTSGIIVDNNSSFAQASSIYYATKTGSTLVKATQAALQ